MKNVEMDSKVLVFYAGQDVKVEVIIQLIVECIADQMDHIAMLEIYK